MQSIERIKTMPFLKTAVKWMKATLAFGTNLEKVLNNQSDINKRLGAIEAAIKSPQYRVAQLEELQRTVDLVKENTEQKIIKLQHGTSAEIEKRQTEIGELKNKNQELARYRTDLSAVINELTKSINEKDEQIQELNAKVKDLMEKTPELLGFGSAYPFTVPPAMVSLGYPVYGMDENYILGDKILGAVYHAGEPVNKKIIGVVRRTDDQV